MINRRKKFLGTLYCCVLVLMFSWTQVGADTVTEPIHVFGDSWQSYSSVAFSPDGQTILVGSSWIELWDISTGELIQRIGMEIGIFNWLQSVAYSPDGQMALSGDGEYQSGEMKLWYIPTGQLIHTFDEHSDIVDTAGVNSVAFSPDGQKALSGNGNTIELYNLYTGELVRTFFSSSVQSVAFSPDGQKILSGGDTRPMLRLWDISTGNVINIFEGHSHIVSSVAYSPDGQKALSGSYDHTIKLWEISTGNLILTLEGHSDNVHSVAFSPNGQNALSGSSDETMKLWDLSTGEVIRTFKPSFLGNNEVTSVAFSPDGQKALSNNVLWDTGLSLNDSATTLEYTLTLDISGTGSGQVDSSGLGTLAHGTNVTLTATADEGSVFVGWTPESCGSTFELTSDITCTAEFRKITPPILLSPSNRVFGEMPVIPGTHAVTTTTRRAPMPSRRAAKGEYHPKRVLVKFMATATERETIRRHFGATLRHNLPLFHMEVWDVPDTDQAFELYAQQSISGIEYIERDYRLKLNSVPNDSDFDKLWGLHNTGGWWKTEDIDIDAPEAWEMLEDESLSKVVCAVVDTGVDYNHPDLTNNMWRNPREIPDNKIDDDNNGFIDDLYGWDFINNDNNPMDDYGHGTHVAGTISAEGNNNIGVAGVDWSRSEKIMALKVMNQGRPTNISSFNSSVFMAFQYALKNGIKCSNFSLGSLYMDNFYREISAVTSNHLLIAAAGNGGEDFIGDNNDVMLVYPSSYDLPNVISVCATDSKDKLASYSNYGSQSVDICAPGSDIYSTLPKNKYGKNSGTSFAAPLVTGAVSLLWSRYPELSAVEVKRMILAGADQIPSLAGVNLVSGRLNVHKALLKVPESTQIFTVTNSGTDILTINSVVLQGDNQDSFELHNDTCTGQTLAVNGTCTVRVSFAPIVAGNLQTQLAVNADLVSIIADLNGIATVLPNQKLTVTWAPSGASYAGDIATVVIPSVVLPNPNGSTDVLSVHLCLINSEPIQLELCGQELTQNLSSEEAANRLGDTIFDPETEIARIPSVVIPESSGGGVAYSVDLRLIKNTNGEMQFEVVEMVPIE